MNPEAKRWSRRELVKAGAVGVAGAMAASSALGAGLKASIHNALSSNDPAAGEPAGAIPQHPGPIIDAHIHLFDTGRPGGVPWPKPDDKALYMPALPPRYEAMSAKHGIVGAIAVEASPLESDNDWLLKVVEANPVIVGMVGDLYPTAPGYDKALERLSKNPLFLGFRTGNLWKRDLLADVQKPGFMEGLKALADAGLVLDSANPDAKLISALRLVSVRVPELRVVIDHLPNAALPETKADLDAYWVDMHELAQKSNVYVKLSEIPRKKDDKLITDVGAYRANLDKLWDMFGENRVIFGSDWPNSDHVASFDQTFEIVRQYAACKSPEAQAKYFFHNSQAAYRWKPRRENQKS
ncbi:MAG TPA: amidohydrolase family protein [Acidobacteriaceae bacterium]|nr:amidohydrolase family protein [Acidobacteriaceae bacterium]